MAHKFATAQYSRIGSASALFFETLLEPVPIDRFVA
jgi:hypothetical protein